MGFFLSRDRENVMVERVKRDRENVIPPRPCFLLKLH